MTQIQFVKYNKAVLNFYKREEGAKQSLDFFSELNFKGLAGYQIMDSMSNDSEKTVITMWNSKEEMHSMARTTKCYLTLVEKSKPYFDRIPERIGYKVLAVKLP